jgi:poly-gamma-glutamate synthesis protein (capsule biosynthesis protein)
MGNWSFGGNTSPTDRDTAIVQVSVKRDLDGTVTTDGYTIIPCCVSSLEKGADEGADNDYRPTPYEEGTEEYARALSKIDGSYEGVGSGADYSSWYASYGGGDS